MDDKMLEAGARAIELAIMRHGVPESDLEGTLDDAKAVYAAMRSLDPEWIAMKEALNQSALQLEKCSAMLASRGILPIATDDAARAVRAALQPRQSK